jgi:hypothetical protein
LICLYLAIIGYLTLLFGCKAQVVKSCIKDDRFYASPQKEKHSGRIADFRKYKVNKTIR